MYVCMYTFRYSDFYVNLHLPCCVPPSSMERFFFPKGPTSKAFHGGAFWGKFMGRDTWRDYRSNQIKILGPKGIFQ